MNSKDTYLQNARIFVAGHLGMVGSALVRALEQRGAQQIITRSRHELDLADQLAVDDFMQINRPEVVIIAAARVGGILANSTYPWEFLFENLVMETNIIGSAHKANVPRLAFLGSSCIYPKLAPQPLAEQSLLTGPLEPTNEAYAIAKIAGVKLCEALHRQYGRDYYSLMPTNLYGPHDNFDLDSSHVIPSLIRKFHDALPDAPVTLWGTGSPMREFMHVDDLAQAVLFTLDKPVEHTLINVGTGTDLPIKDLALLIQRITGHTGPINWDSTKPDGTPRKLMDVNRLAGLGWKATISLEEGLKSTYHWFKTHQDSYKTVHFEQ
jgi:GDP-L-fucose synthase